MLKNTIKPFDIVIIILVAAAIAGISAAVYRGDARPRVVVIKTEAGERMYPLDQNRTLKAEGPLGTTVIEIVDGRVKVVSSPCRDKLCILKGHLKKSGDWSACMPNRVFVEIRGGDKEALDELSY